MQLETVRQESVRLQSENSQLHVLVMQHVERHDEQAREHYQECKRLEDTIAELSYWKQLAGEKLLAAERENSGLRKRCDDLTKLTDKLATGALKLLYHISTLSKWVSLYRVKGIIQGALPRRCCKSPVGLSPNLFAQPHT